MRSPPADFIAQLVDWLAVVANRRRHATTRMIPVASATGTVLTTRLDRDYYVAVGANASSVRLQAIGDRS
jgi:hypothetical protein